MGSDDIYFNEISIDDLVISHKGQKLTTVLESLVEKVNKLERELHDLKNEIKLDLFKD